MNGREARRERGAIRGRREVLGCLLALGVAVACVRLGIWQLARLRQRRARNAVVLAARSQPPVELPTEVVADSLMNRRVRLHGVYDFAREQLWRPRPFEGELGADLVTPLRLADSSGVLVDRGWVSSADGYYVNQSRYRERDTATVSGLALPAPRGRGDVDPRALADSLPYRLLPFVVQELPVGGPADSLPGAPLRLGAPELSNGPHLSYAIQWFSFALITLVGTAALLRRARPT